MLSYYKTTRVDVPIADYLQIIEKLAISEVEKGGKAGGLNHHEVACAIRGADSQATQEDFPKYVQSYARIKARYNILRNDPFYQSLVMSNKAPNLVENTIDFSKDYDNCNTDEKNHIQSELDAFHGNLLIVGEWFGKICYKSIFKFE